MRIAAPACALVPLLMAACAAPPANEAADKRSLAGRYADWPNPLRDMPRGQEQLRRVCGRDGDDPLRSLFCGEQAPAIAGIVELETALGVDSANMKGINGHSVVGH
jgi:hypothetical protein